MDQLKSIEVIMTFEKEAAEADCYEKIVSLIGKWKLVCSVDTITTDMVKSHFNKLIQSKIPILYKQLIHKLMLNDSRWESMDKKEIFESLESLLNSPDSDLRDGIEREVRNMKLDLCSPERVLQWSELKMSLLRLSKVSKGGLSNKEFLHYLSNAMGIKEYLYFVNPIISTLPETEKEIKFGNVSKIIDKIVAHDLPKKDNELDNLAFAAAVKDRIHEPQKTYGLKNQKFARCRICGKSHLGDCKWLQLQCRICNQLGHPNWKCPKRPEGVEKVQVEKRIIQKRPINSQNLMVLEEEPKEKPAENKKESALFAEVSLEEDLLFSDNEYKEPIIGRNTSPEIGGPWIKRKVSKKVGGDGKYRSMHQKLVNIELSDNKQMMHQNLLKKETTPMVEYCLINTHSNSVFKNKNTVNFMCDSGSTSNFFGRKLIPYVRNITHINKVFNTASGEERFNKKGELCFRTRDVNNSEVSIKLEGIINEKSDINLLNIKKSFLSSDPNDTPWVIIDNYKNRIKVHFMNKTFHVLGELCEPSKQPNHAYSSKEGENKIAEIRNIIKAWGYVNKDQFGKTIDETFLKKCLPMLIRSMHIRLLHVGAESLEITFKEQGIPISKSTIEGILKPCVVCRIKDKLKRKFNTLKYRTTQNDHNTSMVNTKAGSNKEKETRIICSTYDGVGYYPGHCIVHDVTYVTNTEKKALSVIIDLKTRLINLYLIEVEDNQNRGKLTREVTQHLVKWCHTKGFPAIVKTDNGPEFRGLYDEFCKDNNIDHHYGAPYTPQQQGTVERVNGTIKKLIEIWIKIKNWPENSWYRCISAVQEIYNITGKKSIRKSPHYEWYGIPPRLKVIPGDDIAVNVTNYMSVRKEDPQSFGKVIYCEYLGRDGKLAHIMLKTLRNGLTTFYVPLQVVGTIAKPLYNAAKESLSMFYPPRNVHSAAQYIENEKLKELKRTENITTDAKKRSWDEINKDEVEQIRIIEEQLRRKRMKEWQEECELEEFSKLIGEPIEVNDKEIDNEETNIKSGGEKLTRIDEIEKLLESQIQEATINKTMKAFNEFGPKLNQAINLRRNDVRKVRYGTQYNETIMLLNQVQGKTHETVSEEDLNSGTHNGAMIAELNQFKENGVLGTKTTKEEAYKQGYQVLQCRWVHSWKIKNSQRIAKSRLVMRGFQDKEKVPVFVDIPNGKIRRLCMVIGLTMGKNGYIADIQTAFLQAPMPQERRIAVQLPNVLPEIIQSNYIQPSGVYILKKAMYGLQDSPKAFCSWLKNQLESKLNWKNIGNGCFIRKDNNNGFDLIVAYVDDLWIWSNQGKGIAKEIQSIIKMEDPKEISYDWQRYIGIDVRRNKNQIELSIQKYVQSMELNTKDGMKIRKDDYPVQANKEETNQRLYKEYSAKVGKLGWLSSNHPGISYVFGELSKLANHPNEESIRKINRTINCIKNNLPCNMIFEPVQGSMEIRLWTDASLRREGLTGTGRLGHIIQLISKGESYLSNKNIVAWSSSTDKRRHESTSSAEILAMIKGMKDAVEIIETLHKMGFTDIYLTILTDARVVQRQIENGKAKENPFDQKNVEYVKQCFKDLQEFGLRETPKLIRVDTSVQKADALTKYIEGSWDQIFKAQ